MTTKHLTTEEFKRRVMNYDNNNGWNFLGERPAIIDFYAPWCSPCRSLAPILDELAEEYNGQVDIYKVNVDQEAELSQYFNIRSIPSILFIPIGDSPKMTHGAISKEDIKELINQQLLSVQPLSFQFY